MRIVFPGGEIRPWLPGDAPELARLADNPNVWRNLRDGFPSPYTKRDAKTWIRAATLQIPQCHFAITANGELAGAIGLLLKSDIHKGTAETGYWLGEPYWCRGIMTGALPAFTAFAFDA